MSLLLSCGVAYGCFVGGYFFNKHLNKPKVERIEEPVEVDKTPIYEELFTSLGLMDPKKDWIKYMGIDTRKNYKLVKFKLSDSLSYLDFVKLTSKLEEKILVDYEGENYKNKIHVYMEKGHMYFRVLNEKIDLIPYEFKRTKKHIIPVATDLDDNVIVWNLKKDSHLKIIGCTNSGKSREQNIIINHIYNNIPHAKLWLMDFKNGVELEPFSRTKNCIAYCEDIKEAPHVLQSFKDEYEERMKRIKEANCRSFDEYIEKVNKSKMARGFLIIDEFSSLMALNNKKKEYDAIQELIDIARLVRAAGLHVILASQRSTADSIPSSMKNNITGTICMKVENELNSRLVLDESGAELLKQSECIAILESTKSYCRSFYIDDSVINETIQRFTRQEEEKPQRAKISVIK